MKTLLIIIFSLQIFSCPKAAKANLEVQYAGHLIRNIESVHDTDALLKPIPVELLISLPVNDSDMLVVSRRCVVLAKYSESELVELQNSMPAKEWEAFYDDYTFYSDDISMYICERSMVKIESKKKYIRFIFSSGKTITVDRMKSAGKLFFFNPHTEVKQCNSADFDQRKYPDF